MKLANRTGKTRSRTIVFVHPMHAACVPFDKSAYHLSVTGMASRRSPEDKALCKQIQVAFGKRLKKVRGQTKQIVLAKALRINRSSVSNLERGTIRVYLDYLYRAARALQVDPAELLPTANEIYPTTELMVAKDHPISEASKPLAEATIAKYRQSNLKYKIVRKTK